MKYNPRIAAAPYFKSRESAEEVRRLYSLDAVTQLNANENPLGPSPKVIEAVQKALPSLNLYPSLGDEPLRGRLAEVIGRRLVEENFVTANGASDLMSIITSAFLEEGDEVIMCKPTYPVFEQFVSRNGGVVVNAPLNVSDFEYDVDSVLAAVSERTKMVYVCNPNNPTGNIVGASRMSRLVESLPDHILVVSDECYHQYVTAADFPDSISHVTGGANLIVIHSFSKAYGLCGLRCGYAIAPREIADYLSRNRNPYHLGTLVYAAAIAALDDTEHVGRSVKVIAEGRQYLYDRLQELAERAWPSQANFILFKPKGSTRRTAQALLESGVMVRDMKSFYLDGYLRVTVGLPAENRRFVEALGRACAA